MFHQLLTTACGLMWLQMVCCMLAPSQRTVPLERITMAFQFHGRKKKYWDIIRIFSNQSICLFCMVSQNTAKYTAFVCCWLD